MNSIIELLSGDVPGGFQLLCLILFIINLILFFFYKGSKLFTKQEYKSKLIKSNIFISTTYIVLWFALKPATLPSSVLFVPVQNESKADYIVCEILENKTKEYLSEDFRLHPWEWFYGTCIKDSLSNFNYRLKIAKKLDIDLIVTGHYLSISEILISVHNEQEALQKTFNIKSYDDLGNEIIKWIQKGFKILNGSNLTLKKISDEKIIKYSQIKWHYLNKQYIKALNLISSSESDTSLYNLIKSKIYLELGKIENTKDRPIEIDKKQNKYFRNIEALLIPIARKGNDTDEMNRILARMYLYEDKYKQAEVFLKKALTQNPYNARVYGDMYYLHQDRFKDLGFENRFEILKKAIELDKGYIDAVYNLANDYFQTGTGIKSGTGTTLALETLNKFVSINDQNKKILNLLASINLQIKHADDAIQIYKKLINLGFTDSELYYNLGIGYFHKKEYEIAEIQFLKSIELDDYPDSYLYLGAINKIQGNYEKALHYYRERIKRSKKGEDDYYAKEALHGLQWILKKQYEDSIKMN